MARRRLPKKRLITAFSVLLACFFCFIAVFYEQDLNGTAYDFDTDLDFVRFIDVGQGDSILIYSNGYCALIDTGTDKSSYQLCADLMRMKIKSIDVLMLSHLHDDHTGGVKEIVKNFKVCNVILPELSIESKELGTAEFAINEVTSSGGDVYNAKQGMNFKIGEFEITVLAQYGDMADENNRSPFVIAEIEGMKFFFSGDAEVKAEKQLLSEGLNLKADVFKAAHHGSSTSNCEELLRAVRPRYIAISAGENNMYNHPHNEVLSRFERIGAKIFRTDTKGDITFYVNDGKITPETER